MSGWDANQVRLDVARDLRAIVELWADLDGEAESRADDKEGPGGSALLMSGPAANLEAWQHRYETAERLAGERADAGLDGAFSPKLGGRDYAGDQEAELQPLLLLGTWEDAIRDEREQPTDLKATVERAADYIRGSIDWMLDDDEYGNMNFIAIDQLASELEQCRSMLENLLRDGDRADWSRVPCVEDKCTEKPRLMKVYADTVDHDHHLCPACRSQYDYDEFIRAANIHAASEAAKDAWVTVADAAHSIGRPANTLRTWIKNWKISTQRAPGVPTTIYVYWADVREADREARVVEARRKANRAA